MRHTCLHAEHLRLQARMVEFAGYEMPLHYGSQIEEHHTVRRAAGVFDVSHMGVVDFGGSRALNVLSLVLANNPARLQAGRALYSCMLNEQGGVIDDLIVYQLGADRYRLVVNAAGKERDLAWMNTHAADVEITRRHDLAILAVQGPQSREIAARMMAEQDRPRIDGLKHFRTAFSGDAQWASTGYTGEDGFEIILPVEQAPGLWRALLAAGAKPVGLGARDTLRLEAGLNLCGSDMDETVTPLECALGWTVAFKPEERNFIGRAALERQLASGPPRKQVGVRLVDKGVLRPHQPVFADGREIGHLSSGAFSPTLGYSIGFAHIPSAEQGPYSVEIRGRRLALEVVEPPFVRSA